MWTKLWSLEDGQNIWSKYVAVFSNDYKTIVQCLHGEVCVSLCQSVNEIPFIIGPHLSTTDCCSGGVVYFDENMHSWFRNSLPS